MKEDKKTKAKTAILKNRKLMSEKNSNEKFISYALGLAKKNLGITSSNPVVACVIVKNGIIISTGITEKNGRPHAEKVAIEKVGDKKILQGAEIYVTLEPCSHYGRTAPCIEEIVKYGFKKVVVAAIDPDKRVNGEGIAKLKSAGIEVVCGILEKEAKEINKAFFKARQSHSPYVTLKIATSLDGKIATSNSKSKWITSEKSRNFSHYLRSINSAIMVGANTIKKDDPLLNCRIEGLEDHSPIRVIISNSLNFDQNLKIFQSARNNQTILLTANKSFKSFADLGLQVILCETQKNGKIDLAKALKKLYEEAEINSVLVEGGSALSTGLLQENLIDELVWIRANKIIGNDGIAAFGDMNLADIESSKLNFFRQKIIEIDQDLIEIYLKKPTLI